MRLTLGRKKTEQKVLDQAALSLEPSPDEREKATTEPDLSDQQVLEYVDSQFKIASDHRRLLEADWALGVAFEEGRQWLGLSTEADKLVSLINEEERFRYLTANKVRPLLLKVESTVTMASPDVRAVPLTDDPLDVQAAKEAEAIRGHCARKFDRHTQTKQRVAWALKSTTCFLKIYWDDTKKNVIPVPQFDGSVNFEEAPVGDLCEEILPGFSVLLDPTARTWEQVRWLIHAETRPLSWFVDRFGEQGKSVRPDARRQVNGHGYVDQYLNGGIGLTSPVAFPSSMRGMDSAVCKEYWEKPSFKFPRGRYIVCAGNVLLYSGPWPYQKNDDFPFVPLGYQERSDSPYHRSLAGELISLQYTYNRMYSAMLEQGEQQVDYIAIPKGAGVQADAFDEIKTRGVKKVYWDATKAPSPPVFSRSQGISQDKFAFLERVERDMQDIAGVHDVTQGLAPAGTPAEAIRLLQQADQTQHSHLRAGIEKSAVRIAEWEVALYAEKAPLDVMLGLLDDKGSVEPDDPSMPPEPVAIVGKAMSMRSLREGGQYRVIYTPGSTLAEGPEEKNQKILTLYQMGLLGTPGTPPASRLAVTLMDLPETERIVESLNQQEAQMQAEQQAMMEMQQEMAASAQQDPMAQMQAEAASKQMSIEEHQAKNDIEEASDERTSTRQHMMELQKMAVQAALTPPEPKPSTGGRSPRKSKG